MNNTQENWPLADAKRNETPDTKRVSRVADVLRGVIAKVVSNLRLSLTLRIAMHYAGQMLKSTVPACLVLVVALCVSEIPQGRRTLDALSAMSPDHGRQYSAAQLTGLDVYEAWMPEENIPLGFAGYDERAKLLFSKMSQYGNACLVICNNTASGTVVAAYQAEELFCHISFAVFAFACMELYRVFAFVRSRNRLQPVVVQPIKDMAEKAAAVSANNLSDRLSVEGAKNELKDLALVINGMLERIETSYNSQKQFVSDASHELRTPIAVIQGYVNMLQRWGKTDKEVLDEGISAIEQEATAMKELVERLLFLARHDKKTLMLEVECFDPLEVMSELHREAQMLSEDHTFELKPAHNTNISGDKDMIKQLMRILLDNAIKYTPAGDSITLGVKQERGQCVLIVTDTGVGIAAEDLPKIFDRFYRCDDARKGQNSGHGLGLSIARIIVASHGGKLKVRSKLGVGTTFSVLFPIENE